MTAEISRKSKIGGKKIQHEEQRLLLQESLYVKTLLFLLTDGPTTAHGLVMSHIFDTAST